MTRLLADRYALEALLGAGGVAEVHRARDRQTGALVACKQLLPQYCADRAVRARFLREAEVAQRLDHPGIVRVLAAGEEAGRPYLILELVEGEDLRRLLDRQGRFPLSEANRIALALARALAHAHAQGVVHRDLKPQNVLIDGQMIKLGDFGLARVQTLASLTGSSLMWGSPEYMAPELFERGRADPRSDLFSLGVILFELVSGRLPWKDRSLARLTSSVRDLAGTLPSLGEGPALDALVASLLAPAPNDRPSSADEVIAVLEGRLAPALPVPTVRCDGCGEPRPQDVPGCFACGHQDVVRGHTEHGRWAVWLRAMKDDVASMEALLQVLGGLTGRSDLRPKFLIGPVSLYSQHEQRRSIKLPAVLFTQLDEPTARHIAGALQARGLRAQATRRGLLDVWLHKPARAPLVFAGGAGAIGILMTWANGNMPGVLVATTLVGVAGAAASYWHRKLRQARGLFQLRPRGESGPVADHLLGSARQTSTTLAAPEVRALFVQVSQELYRLARRAEQLARQQPGGSSEEALARRLLEAAPAVSARLEAIARRLETLDAALERDSDGETMRALAALDRRLATGASEELEAARRDLEATLDRRQRAEAERERLAAGLCRLLATLRDSYRRARSLVTLEERELAAVDQALVELESELTRPPVEQSAPSRA